MRGFVRWAFVVFVFFADFISATATATIMVTADEIEHLAVNYMDENALSGQVTAVTCGHGRQSGVTLAPHAIGSSRGTVFIALSRRQDSQRKTKQLPAWASSGGVRELELEGKKPAG